jgi:hypothetical protein
MGTYWKDLEEKVKELSGEALKDDILKKVDSILIRYGEPYDYYNESGDARDQQSLINKSMNELINYSWVLLDKENNDIVKKLYEACVPEDKRAKKGKSKTDGVKFEEFYLSVYDGMTGLWPYGESLNAAHQNSLGGYTCLKNSLNHIKWLLELGRPHNTEKLKKEYKSKLSKSNDNEYG